MTFNYGMTAYRSGHLAMHFLAWEYSDLFTDSYFQY